MSFDALPPELYSAILDLVPATELQPTVLSVTRAIPLSPVPVHYIFRSIRITYPDQAISLYRRLRLPQETETNEANSRSELQQIAEWVKELSIESWNVDAEVVINIIRLLGMPKLRSLAIWIGPKNFAPEHLEEVFSQPFLSLQRLSLRFRPYVQKATYYQFLKGAYFDSTLSALSRWPESDLRTLSIVQDPLDNAFLQEQKQTFAQPIVFFRFDITSLLLSPPFSSSLTSLRLRIPSRPVLRSLSNRHEVLPLDLEFLDLSTSGVLESEIDMLLIRFAALKHIVLNDCSIMQGDPHERMWHALGKRLALVGVKRAKEREKQLKTWIESRKNARNAPAPTDNPERNVARRAKPGRKGLATAAISLRGASYEAPLPIPGKPSQTKKFKKEKEGPNRAPLPIPGIPKRSKKEKMPSSYSKVRILPSLPTLLSLSLVLPSATEPARHPMIRAEFQEGWAEGVAQLTITRARLRTSAGNGYRIMRVSVASDNGNLSASEGSASSSEERQVVWKTWKMSIG
ncbi:hypothetical protein CPB84DRAFT_529505 [Gymnopilus junonius]|uniref:F-box domain-containing protein n=1 Tax=Gymnopilus junonius TaxID=109634 RepID=A0A9P5P2C0_GYMJU|nr:hypothetical protein CPB84DRAFT_529505 [Gymnopilus junonius]